MLDLVVFGLKKSSNMFIKKFEYISNIKAVAILMVIFLHSASPLFYKYDQISNSRWYVTLIYDSFVRCCVPLFLMVNGASVLNKDYKFKDWIKDKLFLRLILPFIFYFFVVCIVNKRNISNFFYLADIGYWFPFFGIILSLYLIYPIIRIWLKSTKIIWIYYLLFIWFVSTILSFSFPKFTLFSTNAIYPYLGYPILGYLISKINTFRYRDFGLVLYIVSSLITLYFVYITNQSIVYDEKYFGYLSPNVILMSIGLYVFLKNITYVIKSKTLINVRNFLSDHSYGLYFLHPLIITNFYFLHRIIHPIYSDWIIFIIGVVITSSIIFILSKIPVLKNVCG